MDELVAPSLPANKKYHAFFAFSREDRDWVVGLIDELESPPYGFKCCYHDRDFIPGVPVLQNIDNSVQESLKTVVVLSPEYIKSAWCSYETQVVMDYDIETRQGILIPIMLRQCQIPEYIGRLSYIDVSKNDHFMNRLVSGLSRLTQYS